MLSHVCRGSLEERTNVWLEIARVCGPLPLIEDVPTSAFPGRVCPVSKVLRHYSRCPFVARDSSETGERVSLDSDAFPPGDEPEKHAVVYSSAEKVTTIPAEPKART